MQDPKWQCALMQWQQHLEDGLPTGILPFIAFLVGIGNQ
jgi:hypothetical protein